MTAIVWFRRDLRIRDHPALHAACRDDELVVPVFVLDERLLYGRHRSGARTQFLLECLAGLDRALRGRGSRLVIRCGNPVTELPALAREVGADTIHAAVDAGPFAHRRDRAVAEHLAASGVRLRGHPGVFAVDDLRAVRTTGGTPYTVFTPFHRAWLQVPRRGVHRAPATLPPLPGALDPGTIPSLAELRLDQPLADPAPGGEQAGRKAMVRFLGDLVERYDDDRNELGQRGASRLSPYLHFGCISPRDLESRLGDGPGPEAFRRQLCWRDFYAQVLRHFPDNVRHEHQQRYRDRVDWSDDREHFSAWREGLTGYPLVDAAMRQLRREGFMHNRARLVAGSFLTKDLGIDWRWGERHFMELLLDGDEASNNGNWQWIASVGVDPQPVSRRIFNPVLQQQRHDPSGYYVRRYVPELRDVPAEYLAEPWTMPEDVQESSGCRIGADYPRPIVDHAHARREALARYRAAS